MDVVLGAEWLIQLGSYTTNLEEQFMEFNWQGRHHKLYGVNASSFKEGTNTHEDFARHKQSQSKGAIP